MKRSSAVRIAVLVSALVLLVAGLASARAVMTWFTMTSTMTGFDVQNVKVTCSPGYELTPGSLVCPPGSRTTIRDLGVFSRTDSSDPLVKAVASLVFNANLGTDAAGPCWGTVTMRLDNDLGTWEGIFTGQFQYNGQGGFALISDVMAHGVGGEVDGMLLKSSGQGTAIQGYYLDPRDTR